MSNLTLAAICTLAGQIAKCPGFATQQGQMLNFVFDDLVQHQDLKVNRVTQSIVVQANSNGPFALEVDYQRTYDLFFMQNNLPYFLNSITMRQYDEEFKDPSIANYPYEYATDLSTQAKVTANALLTNSKGLLFIYPQSSGQITLTHRYMVIQPTYALPQNDATTIPWFEDQDYLVTATAARLMKVTDDERQPKFEAQALGMLKRHLIMEGDEQQTVKNVRLDPRRFHSRRSLKPTKVTD